MRGRALGPGRLFKRGKSWFLDWRDEFGRRCQKALSSDKRTAERIRSEIIHRRDLAVAGLGSEGGQDLTLDEILELYIEDLRARVSELHFKNVDMRLRHIVGLLDGKRVRDLKPMDVVRIRNRAQQDGAAHRTSNLLADRLRTMLRWAAENEVIARNPLQNMRRLPEGQDHQRYKRRALSDDEIERFLVASRADDEENELRAGLEGMVRVPQTPMWTAFLETGARWNELRQSTWGDLDLAQRFLVLRADDTEGYLSIQVPGNIPVAHFNPQTMEITGKSSKPGHYQYCGSLLNSLFLFSVSSARADISHLRSRFGEHVAEIFDSRRFIAELRHSLMVEDLGGRKVLWVDSIRVRYDKGHIGTNPGKRIRPYYGQKPDQYARECEWRIVVCLSGEDDQEDPLFLTLRDPEAFCRNCAV